MKKIILLIVLLFSFKNVWAFDTTDNKIKVNLSSCIDGDTAKFDYQGEIIKVRFLAIDTPEIKHGNKDNEPYAIEAKEYTCNELKIANNIYLEFDSNSDKQDKYNRYLAWVFIDNNLLQEKIIEKGYGKVAYLYGDYKYTNILKNKQNTAKKNKLGIWNNIKTINYNYLLLFFILGLIILILIILLF